MERQENIRKIGPSISQHGHAIQSCESTESSKDLYLDYDGLSELFQYLNAQDLSNVAMVCKAWYNVARREQYVTGPMYFIERYSSLPDEIKYFLIKPLGICIKRMSSADIQEIKAVDAFPEDCEIVIPRCPRVITNNEEMRHFNYTPFVSTFLPEMLNVNITTYTVMNDETAVRISEQLIERINRVSKVNDGTFVCLMLFCISAEGFAIARSMIEHIIQSGAGRKIDSLWGGLEKTSHINSSSQMPYCLGILMSGAIKTWSLGIDYEWLTKDQIGKKLRLFKDRIQLKTHSIGFMCGRVAHSSFPQRIYINLEAIFKQIFSNVPLIYFFGYSNFGKNTVDLDNPKKGASLNNPSKSDECRQNSGTENLLKAFSTSFLILTYD